MEVVQYKCPNCGANLEFNAGEQNFSCKYCDSGFSSEQLAEIYPENEYHPLDTKEPEKTKEMLEDEAEFAEYNALYNCPGCGAAVVTEATTSATKCFYCHSPVILTGRLSGEYRPAKTIPFKVTREEAEKGFNAFCKGKFFAPTEFKSEAALSEITAVYIPYWLANCTVGGRISAKCTNVRSWTSGDYRYTETEEYVAIRSGDMCFDGIPADASSKADDILMECIEPFEYGEMKGFKMSYLAGYMAEKYDVEKEQVYPRIRDRANTTATDTMQASITGYSSVVIKQNTIDVQGISWQHTLFPVWFLAYKYKDKLYNFAINGQTGKFAGSLPVSAAKVLATIGLSLLGGGLIGTILGGLLWHIS